MIYPSTERKTSKRRDLPPRFPTDATIEDKIRIIVTEKRWENYTEDIRRARVYLLMDLYYRGYQNLGPWDDVKGWASYSDDPLDYMENRFRRNALINAGGLIKMEPSPIVRPGSGSINDIEVALTGQDAWEKAKDEIGYDQLIAEKSLQKVLFGTTFIYSGYRYGNTEKIMRPKMKLSDVEIPAAAVCMNCGMTSEAGTSQCPNCGAPMQQFDPMQSQESSIDGYTTHERGELFSTAFSPLEVKARSKVKGGLKNAPYLIRSFREDVELLNYLYADYLAGKDMDGFAPYASGGPGISSSPGGDASLRYQGLLAGLPGNPYGNQSPYWSTTNYYTDTDVFIGWIRPQCYRGDKDLEKFAPDGLMAVVIGTEVPEYRPEKIDDVWTYEVYYPNTHSFYGDGMFDDAPICRMINQVGQLLHRHLEQDTVPLRLYESSMINEQDITNDPAQKWIKVSTDMDHGLDRAVRDLPAQQLSNDVNIWNAQLRTADADISAATDPLAGQIAGANTPYSAQILAVEQGQTRFLPSKRFNTPAVGDHVRQVLQLAQKHWTDPRTMAEIDQNTGLIAWKQFTGTDLSRGNWTIYIPDNDFKPRTRGEQMQALEQGRAMGLDMLGSPKLRLQLFEKLGIDPSGDMLSTQARRASRIIQRIIAGEQVQPNPLVDDGIVQSSIMQEFLAGPQGDELEKSNPQAWQGIFGYMTTVMQMAAMKQAALGNMGIAPPMPMPPAGGPQQGGKPSQGGGGQPQKVENAQSPVPPGQQQAMPQVPARQGVPSNSGGANQ